MPEPKKASIAWEVTDDDGSQETKPVDADRTSPPPPPPQSAPDSNEPESRSPAHANDGPEQPESKSEPLRRSSNTNQSPPEEKLPRGSRRTSATDDPEQTPSDEPKRHSIVSFKGDEKPKQAPRPSSLDEAQFQKQKHSSLKQKDSPRASSLDETNSHQFRPVTSFKRDSLKHSPRPSSLDDNHGQNQGHVRKKESPRGSLDIDRKQIQPHVERRPKQNDIPADAHRTLPPNNYLGADYDQVPAMDRRPSNQSDRSSEMSIPLHDSRRNSEEIDAVNRRYSSNSEDTSRKS